MEQKEIETIPAKSIMQKVRYDGAQWFGIDYNRAPRLVQQRTLHLPIHGRHHARPPAPTSSCTP